MSSLQHRFEILLPPRFNEGTQLPEELLVQTVLFRGFKEQLKSRFQQIDIRVTTYPVEVY